MEKVKKALENFKVAAKANVWRAAMVAVPVASALGMSASAAGEEVTSSVTAATGVFTSVLSILTGNPIMMVFVGASLVPVGFRIFKSAKRAANG